MTNLYTITYTAKESPSVGLTTSQVKDEIRKRWPKATSRWGEQTGARSLWSKQGHPLVAFQTLLDQDKVYIWANQGPPFTSPSAIIRPEMYEGYNDWPLGCP